MVPEVADIAGWLDEARRDGATMVRTGAMFPGAAPAFLTAGFHVIDTLTLLEMPLTPGRRRTPGGTRGGRPVTRRLRRSMLSEAADVDRAAFGDPWGNDVRSLRDVMSATPRHRARAIGDGAVEAFAISGQAGTTGYLQRLAVAPGSRRRGHARTLVVDALDWMRRHGSTTAMVNTAVDNHPALALYTGIGFRQRPEQLVILESTPT